MKTDNVIDVCIRSLEWARLRNYRGYSKFDALNSPLLRAVSGKSRFLRSAFVFGMSRMPVNIRPLFFVQKKQNPKGLALFARAYLNLYRATGNGFFKDEGLRLLKILLGISKLNEYSGHCWGYDHPWQNIAFFIPPYEPNCVVTCAAAEAFLQAYELTKKNEYLNVAESVANFILKDLSQIDVGPGMCCCSYDLHSSWKVINVNAFASAFLAKLYRLTKKEEYRVSSQAMMRWVISKKTYYHAWYYTDPPEASRITHDNYHTGFVLDSIQDYLEVLPNAEMKKIWHEGLDFYKSNLFTPDHAPKWMHDRTYPQDIHGAAQGIITFSRASADNPLHIDFAKSILEWTLLNLYSKTGGRFYYQKGRFWIKRFTLMRWSQAWMCYAMSCYLLISRRSNE